MAHGISPIVLGLLLLAGPSLGAQGLGSGPLAPVVPEPDLDLVWHQELELPSWLEASLSAKPLSRLVLGWVEVRLSWPQGYHLNYQPQWVGLEVLGLDPGFTPGSLEYSPTDLSLDLGLGEPVPAWKSAASWWLPLLESGQAPVPVKSGVKLVVKWQLCSEDGLCFPPGQRTLALEINHKALDGTLASARVLDQPEAQGLGLFLLFAFLGGLILNFMPCVLPVLSLKLLRLVQLAKSGDPGHSRRHGLATAAGMGATVVVLGLVVLILAQLGQGAAWGFQFQNPVFVLVLALVILVLALALLDVFSLGLAFKAGSWKPAPGASKPGTGFWAAFAEGVLLVILASPCSAPFLGTAMGFAFAAPFALGMLVFLALALGLVLPFLLISSFPRLLGFLPKPGAWMDVLKHVFGFTLLATTIWLASVAQGQLGLQSLLSTGLLLLLVGAAFWAWGQGQGQGGRARLAWRLAGGLTLVLALVAFFPWTWNAQDAAAQRKAGLATGSPEAGAWQVFSPLAVEEALARGEPVFIDFGADWCLTCGVNEQAVLGRPDFAAGLKALGVVPFKGDFTLPDPDIRAWLAKNGRAGVPFYQLLLPGGQSLVLPELLGPDTLTRLTDYLGGQVPES